MRRLEFTLELAVLGIALLPLGCSSCSRGPANGAGDGSTDTGTDTDTDTDTWDGFDAGPTTPCTNDPLADEVCVPGGNFLMGCVPQDNECEDVEKPLHVVQLSPFFIDRKETTWAPFIAFLNTLRDGYNRLPEGVTVDIEPEPAIPVIVWANPKTGGVGGLFKFPVRLNDSGDYEWGIPDDEWDLYYDNPDSWASYIGEEASVGGVTQRGARLYCESLGKRLPTEAQWEYAARGQTTQIYPGLCGDAMDCSWAEYGVCAGVECAQHYSGASCAPVEDLSLNHCSSVWGVERMAGNAVEWVEDELAGDHSSCAAGCVDPEPMKGGHPIFKGGGIGDVVHQFLRISARWYSETDWSWEAGIRCARDDAPYSPPDAGADGGNFLPRP